MGQNPDSGLEIQPFYRIWLAGLEPDYLRLRSKDSDVPRPVGFGQVVKMLRLRFRSSLLFWLFETLDIGNPQFLYGVSLFLCFFCFD